MPSNQSEIFTNILEKTREGFLKTYTTLSGFSNKLHVDIADGIFVNSKTINLDEVSDIDFSGHNSEIHLMVRYPENYFGKALDMGFKRIIFHIETGNTQGYIDEIRNKGILPCLAINPGTDVSLLEAFIGEIEFVLFMTVNPGKQKQALIPKVLENIKSFSKKHSEILLGADGGINPLTVESVKNAGVNHFAVGSAINRNENPKNAYDQIIQLLV